MLSGQQRLGHYANVAIALNKDLDYVQVRVNDTSYIVAQALLDNVCDAVGWDKEGVQIEKTFKGADLEFVKARHPFIDRESLIILEITLQQTPVQDVYTLRQDTGKMTLSSVRNMS